MPFFNMNCGSSALVTWVPLSETTTLGIPWVANSVHKRSMVTWEVAAFTTCTSSHFEYASTVTKNIFPEKGMCNLDHGF